MIDPCDYEALCPLGQPLRPEGYSPPPSLLTQLSLAGINPEEITHVIITHPHLDHCIGSTVKTNEGRYVPAFPHAKYYLGAADWNSVETQADLMSVPEVIHSLRVLNEYRLLTSVNSETDVAPGVTILPMPGETPGHQVLRVRSKGAKLYCIGDLFHAPMEVADPQIMADFNDPEVNLKSRISFLTNASTEDATIFAGHMSLGKIGKTETGFRWQNL
jgi:glyoxylase-like metal-dependent hydrolase (beta-lactamase superfamily II)